MVRALSLLARHWRNWSRDPSWQTLALWLLPSLALHIFSVRQPGHAFMYVSVPIVVAAASVIYISSDKEGHAWPRAGIAATAIVAVCSSLPFLYGPGRLFADSRSVFRAPTLAAIRTYDEVTQRLQATRRTFTPEETAVLASGSRSSRNPDFHLQ